MIVLTAIICNGTTVDLPPVIFDETGGLIGRADNNQMVLRDADRMISRVHAQVVYRGQNYVLVNRGSNDVLHNGHPVGNGREVLLAVGDDIQIGGYLIKVSDGKAVKNDDPFADFASEVVGLSSPAQARQEVVFAPHAAKVKPPPAPTPAPVAPVGNPWSTGIPEDWNLLQSDHEVPCISLALGGVQSVAAPPNPAPLGACLSDLPVARPSSEQSLDALFGLMGGVPHSDPFASSSLLQTTSPTINVSGDHDHDSDLQSPWHDMPMISKQASPPSTSAVPALPGAVFSWEQSENPVTPMQSQHLARKAAQTVSLPSHSIPIKASHVANATQSVHPLSADEHGLMQAFLQGLGTPDLRVSPLNADTMFQLGQLLRESTRGTVELLAARTALKSEVRADVTMVASSANNALKFSPTVEVALQCLLGQPMAGFMGSVDSMRDAYDDLKAHQLGVMAGMRAALSSVIMQFDPAILETKLTARTALTLLIPSGKKARLWELFQELFSQLAHEAEEDFNELFREAFVHEYERCISQLKVSRQP